MPHRRTTFSKFIIEQQQSNRPSDTQLTALLNDVQTACKFIALAVSRGTALDTAQAANDIMIEECSEGGTLCGIISEALDGPFPFPAGSRRGPYLLAFTPLEGSTNLDINVTVGTIFSILAAPDGVTEPAIGDFLQPGSRQLRPASPCTDRPRCWW